jgi:integral membrane protein (TIGR01906 family)
MNLRRSTALSHLVSLLVPLALIGTSLRLLLTPAFYLLEYKMPYFPIDAYGFTTEDRLRWAPFAVDYLVMDVEISYLEELVFPDGTPLFNQRELRHMQDVKSVVQGALTVWILSLASLAVLAAASWRGHWFADYLNGLRRGGAWMLNLAISLGAVAGIGILISPDVFWGFFTLFHQVFFEGDTWLFYYSDTLIRLFPIRFWQDAVLVLAALSLGGGLGAMFGLRKYATSPNPPSTSNHGRENRTTSV